MPVYAGIDIGNGRCKADICDAAGNPQIIRSPSGTESWVSVVHVAPDGKTTVGADAQQLGLVYPEQSADGWKMDLGNAVKKYIGGKFAATEIAAMMIGRIVEQIEKQAGAKIDGVVATCPANFTDQQRQGLLEAFKLAKVNVVQLITEPAAAAFAYAWKDRAGQGRDTLILCTDVGHGTTDVSVLESASGTTKPIATGGLPRLGGRDITDTVVKSILEKVGKATGKCIIFDKLPSELAAELLEKGERAKHALSGQPSTKISINYAGKPQIVDLSQGELHSAILPIVKQITTCIDKTMADAKKSFKEMESLVVAGAPLLSPHLQGVIADHTGLVPRTEIDPASVVAVGAAYLAYNLAREQGGLGFLPDRPQLQEATAHDIGVAVIDETSGVRQSMCSVIVPKNTAVPYEHPPEFFRLERPNQTDVVIEILQGQNGSPAAKCQVIGRLELKGLPPEVQRSPRIKVDFRFDQNTLVVVTATDTISGKSQSVSVKLPK